MKNRLRTVELVHWNPRKLRIPRTELRFGPRIDNFGDLIGPLVIGKMRIGRGNTLNSAVAGLKTGSISRLLSVGSVMHMAKTGDTVWGTGINGKVADAEHAFRSLDIRALRGPLTQSRLRLVHGVDSPNVFGDPALLLPNLCPELTTTTKTRQRILIPNLNELDQFRSHPDFADPRTPIEHLIPMIAGSEIVVGSSLHAIVLADALGVAGALIASRAEHEFKYRDYAAGTGQQDFVISKNAEDATILATNYLRSGRVALSNWDSKPLLDAFPHDLWEKS